MEEKKAWDYCAKEGCGRPRWSWIHNTAMLHETHVFEDAIVEVPC